MTAINIVPEPSSPAGEPIATGAAAALHHLRPGTLSLPQLPPLSLYIHLPWCLKKCPYCDFNSHEFRQPGSLGLEADANQRSSTVTAHAQRHSGHSGPSFATQKRYVEALIADLEASLPLVWGRRVGTVFIGGGTPSLFEPQVLADLLGAVRARLPFTPGAEITLEANPGTFERERFKAFAHAGVTRLSIGVQSFDDAALKRLGRVHDAAQARAAVEEAAQAFSTFNLDLMYALPGQDLPALKADLQAALAFSPPHLSIYHLTLEPNTVFANAPPHGLPDDDLASTMLDTLVQRLGEAGLERYEVSAFARSGHHCRHNLNYWGFGDYLGIGAGAHGKISFPHRVLRQVRWREPAQYMQNAIEGRAVSNQHEVARRDLPFEFMLNQLRLVQGFTQEQFCQRTGLPPSAIQKPLAQAQSQGLMVQDAASGQWRSTARGFDFLSDLQALFLA